MKPKPACVRRPAEHWPRRLIAVSVTLLVVVNAIAFRGLWPSFGAPYLIIHADDAGVWRSVNRGTIEAMERGLVTSASIMVPCPGFEEFAEYARSRPEKDFGIHLTLISDWDDVRWGPVSDVATVASLIEPDGNFWRTIDQFVRHAKTDEIERELRAQVGKGQDRGIRVSHLDCHKNALLWRPDLVELYVRLGQEFDVPIRFCKTFPAEWRDDLPPDCIAAYHRQLDVLRRRRFPLPDVVDTENYDLSHTVKQEYFLDALRKLRPGISVAVIHCADRNSSEWLPPDVAKRHADTQAFLAPETAAEVSAQNVRLIDWKSLTGH